MGNFLICLYTYWAFKLFRLEPESNLGKVAPEVPASVTNSEEHFAKIESEKVIKQMKNAFKKRKVDSFFNSMIKLFYSIYIHICSCIVLHNVHITHTNRSYNFLV